MPAAQNGSEATVKALLDLTRVSSTMITHGLNSINNPSAPSAKPTTTMTDPPNPLHVLKDAALLLKSHATKLGLLLLNPPFTPSAVASTLREMTTSCIPAILSAVELAHPDVWGRLLRHEVDARAAAALRSVEACLEDVRSVAEKGEKPRATRDTLASTGAVWAACDFLAELEELDVGGLALRRAKQYQALIKDALEELKEWREESQAEDEDDEDEDDFEEEEEDDDIFGTAKKLPRDRPELLLSLDDTITKLKRVEILYTAVSKRRITTFTKEKARIHDCVQTMDKLLDGLKKISEATDELASSFYELDEDAIDQNKKALVKEGRQTISLVSKSWDDAEDEFTAWSAKWLDLMK